MADKIRLLPEVVANQIAAGEVVNRPSSVVKEMMENAIDAGATRVKVNYRDGGKELIQIVDDGCGMSPIDARLAFDRHATSKIATSDDLYALHTFGFRGEALASIAAVAQVELRTRQAEDEIGTQTEINGGEFVRQTPVMCPVGSQFFVRNLFYNVPARRRFLEKGTTSASQIRTEFQRIALCNPQIAFELYANDAPVYNLPPASLAGRIVDVIGRHIKQNLLEVSADTTIARIEGFVGRPAAAKKSGAEQFLFVNGRFFLSPYLRKAVLKPYEKLIPESCSPAYFLYISVDPERIDVNVHPQKTEVKFADAEAVWQIVNAAVRETLGKTGAVPLMDFNNDSPVDIPVLERGALYSEPRAMSNFDYNPFREEYVDADAPAPDVEFAGFDVPYDGSMPSGRAGGGACGGTYGGACGGSGGGSGGLWDNASAGGFGPLPAGGLLRDDADGTIYRSALTPDPEEFSDGFRSGDDRFEFIPSQPEAEQQQLMPDQMPGFSSVTSIGNGYASALLGHRFVVVDLRRARERVLYESFLLMLGSGSTVSQQLLFPERLMLSADEYALLEEHAVEFAALGFDLDCCGEGVVEVKGTPAEMAADSVDRLLFELLKAFAQPVSAERLRRERIAGVMARNGAKELPRTISSEDAAALLDRLAACDDRSFTPGGKAIAAELTPEELRAKLG